MRFAKTEEDLYLLVPSEEGEIEVDDEFISDRTMRHLAFVYDDGEVVVINVLSFKTEAEVRAAFMSAAIYEESDDNTRLYELKLPEREAQETIMGITGSLRLRVTGTRQVTRDADLSIKCLRQFMSGYAHGVASCQRPVSDEDLTIALGQEDARFVRGVLLAIKPALKRKEGVVRSLPVMNALGILVREREVDGKHLPLLALAEIDWSRSAWSGHACTMTERGTYTLGGVRQYGQRAYAHLRAQLTLLEEQRKRKRREEIDRSIAEREEAES